MFDPKYFEKQRVEKLLPVQPKDMLEAYDMGVLVDKIEYAQKDNDVEEQTKYLNELRNLTGREDIEVEDIS